MSKKNLCYLLFLLLFSHNSAMIAWDDYCCENPFFLKFSVGGSFSRKANICVDSRAWDPAPQGYNNKVGNSEVYSVMFGFIHNSYINYAVEVSRRPSYKYCKFQSPQATGGQVGFAGTKTRFFNLENTSVMANLYLTGGECWSICLWDNVYLQPFIGGGLGVAYNKMTNFHSVTAVSITQNNITLDEAASIMAPYRHRSLAGQFMLGVELMHCERYALNIGYRFFHAGSFRSNNYMWALANFEPGDVTSGATTFPRWCGKLKANELFFTLKVVF